MIYIVDDLYLKYIDLYQILFIFSRPSWMLYGNKCMSSWTSRAY